jgi:hypothetical protein
MNLLHGNVMKIANRSILRGEWKWTVGHLGVEHVDVAVADLAA